MRNESEDFTDRCITANEIQNTVTGDNLRRLDFLPVAGMRKMPVSKYCSTLVQCSWRRRTRINVTITRDSILQCGVYSVHLAKVAARSCYDYFRLLHNNAMSIGAGKIEPKKKGETLHSHRSFCSTAEFLVYKMSLRIRDAYHLRPVALKATVPQTQPSLQLNLPPNKCFGDLQAMRTEFRTTVEVYRQDVVGWYFSCGRIRSLTGCSRRALRTVLVSDWLLQAAKRFRLAWLPASESMLPGAVVCKQYSDVLLANDPIVLACAVVPMWVIEVSTEKRRNERAGEMGDRRENPPTSGIVRHDSHMRKFGSEHANCSATAAPVQAYQEKFRAPEQRLLLPLNGAAYHALGTQKKKKNGWRENKMRRSSGEMRMKKKQEEGQGTSTSWRKVKRGMYGLTPECKGGRNGRSPSKPVNQRHRQARFSCAKIRERSAEYRTLLKKLRCKMEYTCAERTDMISMHEHANCNRVARNWVFERRAGNSERPRSVKTVGVVERVLRHIENNLEGGTREVARGEGAHQGRLYSPDGILHCWKLKLQPQDGSELLQAKLLDRIFITNRCWAGMTVHNTGLGHACTTAAPPKTIVVLP
ncbi:hypothetical protein PR048_014639 [Dryococelus australis]|uniref:Uncharacterized protein n=1 Tax=Dryococelus australis TaxID=614101 RepID=A0ABQ9HES5_9NEOP|nr:hypothetical protein PR048_014639 [Dryococelus australis]